MVQKKKRTKINIGMVGFGTVGSGVWKILNKQRKILSERLGADLQISKVVVRSKKKRRSPVVPASKLSTDIQDLIQDPKIKIIVEVMGDVKASKSLVLQAIRAKKHIVSANKALFALHGPEIFAAAKKHQVDVCFEAAVAGGIPILRSLREGLVANQITSLHGILNGTCNYILSEMSEHGSDFSGTLKRAQKAGYAEADPSFDVDGIDAAHKLAILIAIAYGHSIDFKKLYIEGIRQITAFDIECAKNFGYEIKLLAITKKSKQGISARVHPTMVSKDSMLAAVQGVNNAVLLEGDFVGECMLYGRGAGGGPTASAVVGDIVEVSRNILSGVALTVPPLGTAEPAKSEIKIIAMTDLKGEYYLRFQVLDRPGVLAEISKVLSRYKISISSVYQNVLGTGKEVPIVILTHDALEKNVQRAIQQINRLKNIQRPTTLIRIEGSCR